TALIIAAFPQLDGYVKTGKSRFIAVTTAKRSSLAPDVPSVSETIPGYDFSSEMGIVVPAGTPEDLVNRFASGVAKALQDPMALRALEGMGAVVVGSTPDEYRKNLEANRLKFQKAIQ